MRHDPPPRHGVAATELAVCLPVLLLLLLGMIETCSMIFLKQSLSISAYEGAHAALEKDATAADIRAACQAVLDDRRVRNASISTVPANLATVAEGDYFEVRVSAPTNPNSVLPARFFRDRTLAGAAKFVKEY